MTKSYSPFRYPGGKASWVPDVLAHWERHGLSPSVIVEPFCGGAGLSLRMLEEGHVKRAILSDKHEGIHIFWRLLVHGYSDKIVQELLEPGSTCDAGVQLAAETLIANRSNYNGILHPHARPNKSLDRLNIQSLVKAVKKAAALLNESCCVFGFNKGDWKNTIQLGCDAMASFHFFDPPYYMQGQRLYQHAFTEDGHKELASVLQRFDSIYPHRWMLAYDDHPRIRELYHWAKTKTKGKELVIITK